MRAIVKVFVVWTLGLAALFGSSGVSLAERPQIPVATFCGCTCWYSGAGWKTTSKGVTFTTDRSCSIYNGQTCFCDGQTCYLKYDGAARYKGALDDCKSSPLSKAEPLPPTPPPGTGGVSPPVVAPGFQPPAAR